VRIAEVFDDELVLADSLDDDDGDTDVDDVICA